MSEIPDIDEILEPELTVPVKPRVVVKKKATKPYKYYRQVRSELQDWWNEFNGELGEKGSYKYGTIRQFIISRTKSRLEQQWLMQMIGPQPDPEEEPEVPWLGDWYSRRLNGSYFPEQQAKVKAISDALKSKLIQIEAVHGMRPAIVVIMAQYMKWMEQLSSAFGGQLFNPNLSANDPENISRSSTYMSTYSQIVDKTYEAMNMYMKLNGIDPEEVNQSITFNTQVNAPQITMPEEQGNNKKEVELLKLARQLQYHADKLKLPLPDKLVSKDEPVEIKGEIKESKKEKVQ